MQLLTFVLQTFGSQTSLKRQRVLAYTLTLCAVLFLFSPSVSAQTVNIPDANLRAAIAEVLDKPQGARITRDEMARLTRLDANRRDIRDLTGLEHARNLEHLEFNHNQISDISPLAGLIRLHVVEVGENAISDISSLKGLVNLEGLHLAHNLISDLSPLDDLINLRWINLGHNAISDLSPIAGLIKLEWIGMTDNLLARPGTPRGLNQPAALPFLGYPHSKPFCLGRFTEIERNKCVWRRNIRYFAFSTRNRFERIVSCW